MLCPDCGVECGWEHLEGCDVARCLTTGGQRLGCSEGECGRDIWSGEWPGVADAMRLGFWTRWVDSVTGVPIPFNIARRGTWKECGADDEGATANLNRLRPPYAHWDIKTIRWEKS
jgi:hypothetical protein